MKQHLQNQRSSKSKDMKALLEGYHTIQRELDALNSEEKNIAEIFQGENVTNQLDNVNKDELPYDPADKEFLIDKDLEEIVFLDGSVGSASLSEGEIIDEFDFDEPENTIDNDTIEELELRKRCLESLEAREGTVKSSITKRKKKRRRTRRRKSHLQVSGILATVSSHKSYRDQTDAFLQFTGAVPPPLPCTKPPPSPPPPPPPPGLSQHTNGHHPWYPTPITSGLDDDYLELFGTHDVDLRIDCPILSTVPQTVVLDNYEHVQMEISSDNEVEMVKDIVDDDETEVATFKLEHELNIHLRQLREEAERDDEESPKMNSADDDGSPDEKSSLVEMTEDMNEIGSSPEDLESQLRRRLLENMQKRKKQEEIKNVKDRVDVVKSETPTLSNPITPLESDTDSRPLSPTAVTVKTALNIKKTIGKYGIVRKTTKLGIVKGIGRPSRSEKFIITVDDDGSSDEELKVRNDMRKLDPNSSLEELLAMKKRCHALISELYPQVESDLSDLRTLMTQLSACRKERKHLNEVVQKLRKQLDDSEVQFRKVRSAETNFTNRLSKIRGKAKEGQIKYKRMHDDLIQLIHIIRDHPQTKKNKSKLSLDVASDSVVNRKRNLELSLSREVIPVKKAKSSTSQQETLSSSRLDPYTTLCPYQLNGQCQQQSDCPYQHPVFPVALNNKAPYLSEKLPLSVPSDAIVGVKWSNVGSGLFTKYRCKACKSLIPISTLHLRLDLDCRSCRDDNLKCLHHSLCRLEWSRTHGKNLSPLCKRITELIGNIQLSADFNVSHLKHCLLGWLSVRDNNDSDIYSKSFDFIRPLLQTLNFIEEAVWFVYDCLMSYTARRSLLLAALEIAKTSSSVTFALKIILSLTQLECISGHRDTARGTLLDLLHNHDSGWISRKGHMYLWCLCIYLTATNDAPYFEVESESVKLISPTEFISLIPNSCLPTRGPTIKSLIREALKSIDQEDPITGNLPLVDFDSIRVEFEEEEDTEAYFAMLELYLRLLLYNLPDDDDEEDVEEEEAMESQERQSVFQSVFKLCCSYFASNTSDAMRIRPYAVRLFIYYLTWTFQQQKLSAITWDWFTKRCQDYKIAYENLLPLFVYMVALNIGVTKANKTDAKTLLCRFARWLFDLPDEDDTECERLYRAFLGLDCIPRLSTKQTNVTRESLEKSGSVVYIWLCLSILLHINDRSYEVYTLLTREAVPMLLPKQKDVGVSLCFALWALKSGLESRFVTVDQYIGAIDFCLHRVSQLRSISTALEVVKEIELGYLPNNDCRLKPFHRTFQKFGRQGYPIIRFVVGALNALQEFRSAFAMCQDLSTEKHLPCGERFWLLYLRSAELCELHLSIQLDIAARACESVPMSKRLWLSYRNLAKATKPNRRVSLVKDIDNLMAKYGMT